MQVIKQTNFIEIIYRDDFDLFLNSDYQTYRRKWKEYPKNQFISVYPLNIDIFITNRCNLKCIMCKRTIDYQKNNFHNANLDMDFRIFKRVIDEIAGNEVYALHITSFGEPLMHPEITEMVHYARDKGILDVFISTNASLLNEKISQNLIDAGLTRLIISFDSPIKETYERIRLGAKFERVYENIVNFMEMRKRLRSDYPIVRVQMVEMAQNTNEAVKFEEMFKNVVDAIGYSEHVSFYTNQKDDRSLEEKQENYDFVDEQLWQRFSIDVDGSAFACLMLREDMKLGNIRENSIKDLWQEPKMTEYRKKHSSKACRTILGCSQCGRGLTSSSKYK